MKIDPAKMPLKIYIMNSENLVVVIENRKVRRVKWDEVKKF